jgi:hypothetical protein
MNLLLGLRPLLFVPEQLQNMELRSQTRALIYFEALPKSRDLTLHVISSHGVIFKGHRKSLAYRSLVKVDTC